MTTDIPTAIEQMDHALTVKELARIINVSISNLYAQCKSGRVPHFLFGGSIRFDPHITADWLRTSLPKAVVRSMVTTRISREHLSIRHDRSTLRNQYLPPSR